jgi:hypothetical protein
MVRLLRLERPISLEKIEQLSWLWTNVCLEKSQECKAATPILQSPVRSGSVTTSEVLYSTIVSCDSCE